MRSMRLFFCEKGGIVSADLSKGKLFTKESIWRRERSFFFWSISFLSLSHFTLFSLAFELRTFFNGFANVLLLLLRFQSSCDKLNKDEGFTSEMDFFEPVRSSRSLLLSPHKWKSFFLSVC